MGQADLFEAVVEVPGQTEDLDDVQGVEFEKFSQVVVSGTDWTTETIISQIDKGNIQLNPKFQRRDAWVAKRKSEFIESLILGLPIPQIVLAESKTRRGSYIVIDGKQRLLSIRQFASLGNDTIFAPLKLTGLGIRSDLKNYTLEKLRADPQRASDVSAFENQPIRTVVIKNWDSEQVLYQIFLRLNTGSVPLSPQELRQALHPGPFIEFIDEKSATSAGLRTILKLKKPDFRMRDAELLTRWFAFRHFAASYKGNLKKFIDDACQDLNQSWINDEIDFEAEMQAFELAIDTTLKVFEESAFRKWNGSEFEGLFNRAIFDVTTFYFSDPSIREVALENKLSIVEKFKDLCSSDDEFLASIERTTKSIVSTTKRFEAWANALGEACDIKVISPLVHTGH